MIIFIESTSINIPLPWQHNVPLTHPLLVRKAEEVSINDLRVRCVWNTIPRIISIFPPLPRNSWPCM